MNWLDILLTILLIGGFILGLRMGLIGALLVAAGVIAGWQIAGHFADDLGAATSGSAAADTAWTFVWYLLLFAAVSLVFGLALKVVRPMLSASTAGTSDAAEKVGAIAVGALVAALVCGAVITGLTRLTYDFDRPPGGAAAVHARNVRDGLDAALVGSVFTRAYVEVVYNVPGGALGFVPDDFEAAVTILRGRIDAGRY